MGPEDSGGRKYFYCIIESRKAERFGKIGFDQREVFTVNYKDLAAVVSDAAKSSYEVLRDGITHQRVTESVMKTHTVIPLRFGQVPASKEAVKQFLSDHYVDLKKLLKELDGRTELGLKMMWKMEEVLKDLVKGDDRIRILSKQLYSKPVNSSTNPYALKLELGRLVADFLRARGEEIADDVYETLSQHAVKGMRGALLNDQMILNASFLVEKAKEKMFDDAVNRMDAMHGAQTSLKYVVTPPYSFALL